MKKTDMRKKNSYPPVAGTRPPASVPQAIPPVIAASTSKSPAPIARPAAPTARVPASAPVASSPAPSTGKPLLPARLAGTPQSQVVHFEFQHAGARSVCLAGSFNNWQPEGTAMAAVGSGKWAKDLPLLPGTYEYRLVVDGQWMEDPQAKKSAPNPFGTWNSVLMVPPVS
jgi:Glycogen recognition site of AMP-activated protein kinase